MLLVATADLLLYTPVKDHKVPCKYEIVTAFRLVGASLLVKNYFSKLRPQLDNFNSQIFPLIKQSLSPCVTMFITQCIKLPTVKPL